MFNLQLPKFLLHMISTVKYQTLSYFTKFKSLFPIRNFLAGF